MNNSILNIEVQEYIDANLKTDITSILLKGTSFAQIEPKEIVAQIEAKKRCKKKLPSWFNCNCIYYPNKLNIEQTSSEITAKYKSDLVSGESIIDLTGGFGVDCLYFSKQFKSVEHCEINKDLSHIVQYNYNQLGISNIVCIKNDGIAYLKSGKNEYDWIYIDPSRRHDSKGKVFFLNDCQPNVPEHLDLLFKHSSNIMIKTSPLLDLTIGINELKRVKSIHVIAVNNEVKELLWILEAGYKNPISIETVNIKNDKNESFKFLIDEEQNTESNYSKPLTYLYEPNSALLKAGAFNVISKKLEIPKLHKHSHLYTSDRLLDFPGRIFHVEKVVPYSKKEIKQLNISKANITTRNFSETVQQIRKRLKITDGGNIYLFFTTDFNNHKIVIVCSKTT